MTYLLLAIFVLLQIGDVWTTYNVIQSNKGHEGNAIMAWLMDKLGILPAFFVMKVSALVAVYFLPWQAILVLDAIYAYVVYQNYQILRK